jgi:hypothetical protein
MLRDISDLLAMDDLSCYTTLQLLRLFRKELGNWHFHIPSPMTWSS